MKGSVFVIGGARSGKSRYAVELAKKISKKVAYIATCTDPDKEMKQRISLHKKGRPKSWKTITCSKDIKDVLLGLKGVDAVIIDCIGLLVWNLMDNRLSDAKIKSFMKEMVRIISRCRFTTIVVSNEVGGGIIPDNYLARRFRDLLGTVNQIMAKEVDEVVFMQAGLPLILKSKNDREIICSC